jgi:hypothetical protein
MSDFEKTLQYVNRLSRLQARLQHPELDALLARIKRLETSPKKLEEVMSLHPELVELRASLIDVLKDPQLNRAQKAAEIAKRFEVLKKNGVIDAGTHRDLVRLGILLIFAAPDPTIVASDVIGLCMLAAGLLLESEKHGSR